MKTSLETIAAFVAVAIWADGEFDEAEKTIIEEIADAFELDTTAFTSAVNAEVEKVANMSDDDDVEDYLDDAAEKVDDEEIGQIYQAVMQVLIADNELTKAEINNLLVIADALGLEEDDAIMMLLDLVKTEPELEINFD